MRFAIIGCGAVANMHALSINELNNAELKAVADTNEETAKSFGEEASKAVKIILAVYESFKTGREVKINYNI